MDIGVLLQQGGQVSVQTGIINLAGFVVGIAGIVLVAVWWAYLYR